MREAAANLPPPDELDERSFQILVRRLADDLAFGWDASPFTGSATDFAQSRVYLAGDPIKLIDWKTTARRPVAYVKEHEAPKRMPFYIVVDTSASMAAGSTRLTKHDLAVWIAGALGLAAQRRFSPAAVVSGGERESIAAPTLVRGALWRALEPLRRADRAEQTRLATRIEEVRRRLTRTGMIVVISDMHEPGAAEALALAGQRHDCALVRVVDPAETRPLRAGFVRAAEAETGAPALIAGRRRERLVTGDLDETLDKAGVDRLRLATSEPFVAPLRWFFSNRGVARRDAR